MKISKDFILKIIKEEIKRVLYEEEDPVELTKQKLIELFVTYRRKITDSPTENDVIRIDAKEQIKQIAPGMSPAGVIEMLRGEVDAQLFNTVVTLLTADKAYSDRLDNYGMSEPPPQDTHRIYNAADDGFMRVPKSQSAVDKQLDTRKDRKNLVKT